MRVYGALMWSLGKVINTPEVVRVYLGSFWAKPLQNTENRSEVVRCPLHPVIHAPVHAVSVDVGVCVFVNVCLCGYTWSSFHVFEHFAWQFLEIKFDLICLPSPQTPV